MISSQEKSRTDALDMKACALCGLERPLRSSHIIPRFIFKHLKRSSSTGFMRDGSQMNQRAQDGIKLPLLCGNCEGTLSEWERVFSERIYYPCTKARNGPLVYEEWMLKFAVSVSWRSLLWYYMEQTRRDETESESEDILLKKALGTWRTYLMGKLPHPKSFEQHMLLMDCLEASTPPPMGFPPNVNRFFTRGTYMGLSYSNGQPRFVFTKMGRVFLFGFIGIDKPRQWVGTKINVRHGSIGGNVTLPTPVFHYLADRAREAEDRYEAMSERQRGVIADTIEKSPEQFAESETFEMMKRDIELFGNDAVFRSGAKQPG